MTRTYRDITVRARNFRIAALVVASAVVPAVASAQDSASATARIPVHQLKNIVTSDTTVLMGLAVARHLPNGSVLVNDPTRRQLVLFDSTLKHFKIIADTSTNSPNSYGLRPSIGGLVPYMADSTLFVDTESSAFLVIDPQGKFVRIMAPTRASDLNYVAAGTYGYAAFDPKGRMVYRSVRRLPASSQSSFSMGMGNGKPVITVQPDSGPIMRMDFDKRTVDTIGMIKVPIAKSAMVTSSSAIMMYQVVNPLPIGDDWTMLPDGTIAIVRSQDYHIDWLGADGKLTSTPKMPFDWKRITLEDKQQMLDSVKKADADARAKQPPPPPTIGFTMPARPFVTVETSELPDFYPAVRDGQVRADREGNVWILPSTSTAAKGGGLVYDVVNREGKIFERVQLPPGRTLVGFGPKGIVYMHYVIKDKVVAAIERAVVAQ